MGDGAVPVDQPDPSRGPWQQTFSGACFYPMDPRVEDLDAQDIAHHLAIEPRYMGATRAPNSVAEHSVRVSVLVEALMRRAYPFASERMVRRAGLAGLLHDAPEAHVRDLPRPLKRLPALAVYREIEARNARVVETWASLPAGALEWPVVKRADDVLLWTEKRDLLNPPRFAWAVDRFDPAQAHPARIGLWTPEGARRWARDLPARVRREGIARGIYEAARELAASGPWPWWHAEQRFLARWTSYEDLWGQPYREFFHYHRCDDCQDARACSAVCAVRDLTPTSGVPMGEDELCRACAAARQAR